MEMEMMMVLASRVPPMMAWAAMATTMMLKINMLSTQAWEVEI